MTRIKTSLDLEKLPANLKLSLSPVKASSEKHQEFMLTKSEEIEKLRKI